MSGESSAAPREHGWNGGPLVRAGGRSTAARHDAGFGRLVVAALRLARDGFATLGLWRERAQQRRALAELDDRLLRDIGLTRMEVKFESRKPFWRV